MKSTGRIVNGKAGKRIKTGKEITRRTKPKQKPGNIATGKQARIIHI